MNKFNSTSRFSDRVTNYIKYRPNYPPEVIAFLKKEKMLDTHSVIADIGSGTGISSELFLKNGNVVFGVEPNEGMRQAAERLLINYPSFKSIEGTAEETKIKNNSVDLLVAGQAFHWFDVERSRTEFMRILKPGAHVLLLWNDRITETDAFLKAYEAFLQEYSTDYKEVNHKNLEDPMFDRFFGKGNWEMHAFPNEQVFDLEGLKGRLLSSSYAPGAEHPRHEAMLIALKELFNVHQQNDRVKILYDTKLYYGNLI